MSDLTIVIPSNRKLSAARESLESAIIFAEKNGCALIVSDNSGDPEKQSRFAGSSPNLTYLLSPGADASHNLLRALEQVSTPFVMPMGDDDAIYRLDGVEQCDLASLSSDVVGVKPRTMAWTIDDGVRIVDRLALLDEDAGQRIETYNREVKGVNNVYYSIYRTWAFRSVASLFCGHHPTRGGYCDWAMSFAFIACGRMLHDPSLIFRYDLGRWAGKGRAEKSATELYQAVGLPDYAVRYEPLLRFVDGFVFISMSGLPIVEAQRLSAQRMNARLMLNVFALAQRGAPQSYSAASAAFVDRIPTMSDPLDAFHAALPVLEELKPGLGVDYERFLATATA